jgi:glycosidase
MIKSLQEVDISQMTAGKFTPSPLAWEDQVLYFLLIDRFSDNNEQGFSSTGNTPLFQPADNADAIGSDSDRAAWENAGNTWVNGKISGITGKLSYLKNLGITALWISPVFKQVSFQNTYHGYGIQHFLEVDTHFGNKEDLKALVQAAHQLGMYVILDIILNHSGNVFSYNPDRYAVTQNGQTFLQPRWDGRPYAVKGFNNSLGNPIIPFTSGVGCGPDDAIWPVEFRDPAHFTQEGPIMNMDFDPEFRDGDFFDLKDIHMGTGTTEDFDASPALLNQITIYKYWIALLDIDGFRIDTVKHMEPGAVRLFASAIHEFTQTLGKENFYLIGEITGDRDFAYTILQQTGIDAALGIAEVQPLLSATVKGKVAPDAYFNLFRNSIRVGKKSHTWFRNKVVVMIDDHDKVTQGSHKSRFCAFDQGAQLITNAIAANLTTLGIPCIYYGSEQSFDGQGDGDFSDRYIREAMFGGGFGAFRSKGKHFFDPASPVYKSVSKIISIRNKQIALRRGRQYLREISGDGISFGIPQFLGSSDKINSLIAWSRIIDDQEIVVAMNSDTNHSTSAWVTIDNGMHSTGDVYSALYPDKGVVPDAIVQAKNGKAIFITLPAAGFVIMSK